MTELIIKVEDDFLREANLKGMEKQFELVRCKDCKDYQTDWETSYPNRHYCATMDSTMPEDGFCSYAERRTDEID